MKRYFFGSLVAACGWLSSAISYGEVRFECSGQMSIYSGGAHGGEWNNTPVELVMNQTRNNRFQLDLKVEGRTVKRYSRIRRDVYQIGGNVGGAEVVAYRSDVEGAEVSLYTPSAFLGHPNFSLRGNIKGPNGWPHYELSCHGEL